VVGAYLSSHRPRHGDQAELARLIGKSTRTLCSWKGRGGKTGRPGRPRHTAEKRAALRREIEPRWRELPRGHDGWRTVCACLAREGIDAPTGLVQEIVHELKAERAERRRRRIEENRVHIEVLVRDALWSADQTHLGRDEHGAIKGLVVRECYVPRTLALSVGPPACGTDVIRLLEHAAEERGTWPFVVQLDNGSENKYAWMEACMRDRHVTVLWNEPRTPEHNARAERTIGSLKRASGLDMRATDDARAPRSRSSVSARLSLAWRELDHMTPRAALDGCTPAEVDRIAPRAEDVACRARFHEELSRELQRITLEPGSARDRRKRAREATWRTLERFGLVLRTRGGCLVPTGKPEGVL
jgi:hypothetical protein